ncbi:MAG: trigger factor [Candidatus Komeilibacteria bacterium]|nr:trigger factor [Candidatus Komeilibacteria bacterium]
MQITREELDRGRVKLTIEIPVTDMEPFLERAAERLSHSKPIAGFRPGRAPRAVVQKQFGDTALYEQAIDDVVARTLWAALKEQQIDSVGRPEIAVVKLAPGNPVVYTATISIMPVVTLNDWQSIRVTPEPVVVTDTDIDKVIEDIRNMQATETLVLREIRNGDKAEVNFTVMRDGVVIEGGTGKKFQVIVGSQQMIPGFESALLGLKVNDTKEFTLTFPKPYAQESLAGTDAQFSVAVLAVYERALPDKNDEWAMRVVGKPYSELRAMIRGNLAGEKKEQASRHDENTVIERVIERATFSSLPENMLHAEVEKMLLELENDVQHRGMEWEKYLKSIKRTKEELSSEFRPQAEVRVKGALVLRRLADELSLAASAAEIEEEIQKQRDAYAGNPEALRRIANEDFKRYVSISIANRKVMEELMKRLVQKNTTT